MKYNDKETLYRHLYRMMKRIRYFELGIETQYKLNIVRGAAHLCLGEEAIAAGVCAVLEKDDYIATTHRGHGHLLAKGSDPRFMMAELLGRETGYCKGKGGSMHISDYSVGVLCANGIVGGGIPIATGAGLAVKMKGMSNIVTCFFGDGAVCQGNFHEAVNMAAAWKLPVLFVCENNRYAISTRTRSVLAPEKISDLAGAYGIESMTVDGNDVLQVYDAAEKLKAGILNGEGPKFIEADTFRLAGHYIGDDENYRDREATKKEWENEPIARFERWMAAEYPLLAPELAEIDTQEREAMNEAIAEAVTAPEPPVSIIYDDLFTHSAAWERRSVSEKDYN